MTRRPHWLIFGIGNPARGDDALAPLLIEKLQDWVAGRPELPVEVTLLTDFQLNIEHALDLRGKGAAIFLDARVGMSRPVDIELIAPRFDAAHTTHAFSPGGVLAVAGQIGIPAPPSWTLSLKGEDFTLGAPISATGRQALDAAFHYLTAALVCAAAPSNECNPGSIESQNISIN